MKTAYPAIVHTEGESYWVEFPDLDGCFSDGDTMADAGTNYTDAAMRQMERRFRAIYREAQADIIEKLNELNEEGIPVFITYERTAEAS